MYGEWMNKIPIKIIKEDIEEYEKKEEERNVMMKQTAYGKTK